MSCSRKRRPGDISKRRRPAARRITRRRRAGSRGRGWRTIRRSGCPTASPGRRSAMPRSSTSTRPPISRATVGTPLSRLAAFGSFLLDSKDAEEALDFTYRDVSAAFDQFLKEAGDRPIILAGHSQGALHLVRLLRDKVAGKPIAKRIVAAYVVGWPIDTASDLPALGLPACTAPDQTGCILSWLTFGEPANPDLIVDHWEKTKGLNGGDRRKKEVLCVNPVTGTRNGSAPPQDNPGTLVPTADLRSATLEPDAVGARCDEGLLIAGGRIPPLGPYVLPGNNYHVYDYALFWSAIRRDAERRLAAWR